VRGVKGLLADGNDIVVAVCRIVDEYEATETSVIACICQSFGGEGHLQLIGAVGRKMIRHVNRELEVATAIEASILAVDVNPCFVVNSSKVQVCPLASPVCWNIKRSREPRIPHPAALDACGDVSHEFDPGVNTIYSTDLISRFRDMTGPEPPAQKSPRKAGCQRRSCLTRSDTSRCH
jgi:hypothetical protein